MFEPNPYVYNISAMSRILRIAEQSIVRFEEWANCVFVITKGRRPRFWKKVNFLFHFADWRRHQSKGLIVDRLSTEDFKVQNFKKRSNYICQLKPDTIKCQCGDYKNQVKFLEKVGVCKHGYAVLSFLGVAKLSEYKAKKVYETCVQKQLEKESEKWAVARTDAYSFSVTKPGDSLYWCEAKPRTIKCECYGYKSKIGDNLCKHGYAVLRSLEYNNLSQYIRNYEWMIDDYNEKEEMAARMNQELEEADAMDCLFQANGWSL